MGVFYVVGVIPAAWIWLRASPESMGLRIDGDAAEQDQTPKDDEEPEKVRSKADIEDGLSFREARGTRFFWGIAPAYIFLLMAQVGGIAHQFGLARETLNEAQTALAVAILPVMSIVGRLLGGWVVDKVPIRRFALFIMLLQILALAILSLGAGPVALCLGLAVFGCTVGNLLMLQPLLIAEAFGLRAYARIFSVANLMSSWGTAAGPAVMGYVFALNAEQYSGAYLFAAAAAALGFVLFALGGPLPSAQKDSTPA
jgi:sugar phosphate permease